MKENGMENNKRKQHIEEDNIYWHHKDKEELDVLNSL